jgi:RTX calcium-binding nonapeptide repeat (4 copies)
MDAFAEARAASSNGSPSTASNMLEGGRGDDLLTATAVAPENVDGAAIAKNVLSGNLGDDHLVASAAGDSSGNLPFVSNSLSGGAGDDQLDASATASAVGPGGTVQASNELEGGPAMID